MPIVGFDFKKIQVEKKALIQGQIKLKNNISIKEVKQDKTPLGEILKFDFEFNTTYEPKIGEVVLKGTISYLEDSTKVKAIMDEWKKNKKIPEPLMVSLVNTILTKCNIKALSLEQEVNLPPHMNLPKVGQKTDVKKFVK